MVRINYLPWFLALAGVFVLLNIDSLWSSSIDLAHHYALAYRISEQWWLNPHFDPSLGEMNIYPRGGHVIAAIIGTLFNSTFVGIQITALASIAIIWLSVLAMLNNMPRRIATIALVSFFILFLTNAVILRFELHGREVVSNFFYSQLLATAFLYLSLLLSIRIEKKHGELWAAASLLPIMLFIESIHLLPAVQILGLIGGITAIKIFRAYKNHERYGKLKIASAAAISIVSTAGLILHPSFSAMRSIGKNEGYLEMHHVSYPIGVISISILVLITSLVLFVQWARRDDKLVEAKYLALYGAATAAACILQYILTFYNLGSDYAVKKYGFSLLTIMLIQLSMLIPLMVTKPNHNETQYSTANSGIMHKIAIYILGFLVLLLSVPHGKYSDLSTLVNLEKKITSLSYNMTPQAPAGKSNIVIGLDGLPASMNYLFSIALAKTPRDSSLIGFFFKGKPLGDEYDQVISSSDNPIYGSSGSCKSSVPGDVSVIDSSCVYRRIKRLEGCENLFDFTTTFVLPSLLQGFSGRENHGRWTNGKTARFTCLANGNKYNMAKLEMVPFTKGPLKTQRLSLSVNGIQVYQGSVSTVRGPNNPIIIDLSNVPASQKYAIEFNLPDATSPKEIGYSENEKRKPGFSVDDRKLGFSVQKITFH